MNDFRKYHSTNELYQPKSTQSTPQKPHSKFKINSLPASPNVDRYSPRKSSVFTNREYISPHRSSLQRSMRTSPVKRQPNEGDQVLHEVDNFLSNVKTIQRLNAVRNLENEFNDSKKNQTVNDTDSFLQEISLKHQVNEERLRSNEKHLKKSDLKPFVKQQTWRCGDNIEGVPDYGAGLRNIYENSDDHSKQGSNINVDPNLESQRSAAYQINSSDFSVHSNNSTSISEKHLSESSSETTQITAFNNYKETQNEVLSSPSPIDTNALSILSKHKNLLAETAKSSHEKIHRKQRNKNHIIHAPSNSGLMSLADIWNTATHFSDASSSKLLQKLQEEKLRRQHCEQLIKELQDRNLELQQKIAVAIKVDDSKNNLIEQFQEALEKVTSKLESLSKSKSEWDKEVENLKKEHSHEIEVARQQIVYHEKEASKALNLAHANQDKLQYLEKQCRDLQNELQSIEAKFEEVQHNYFKEIERNKNLSDILTQKELDLTESRSIVTEARNEVVQSKKAVEVCQSEFTSLKEECAKLQLELKEESKRRISLTQQKNILLEEVDSYKDVEKKLQDELKKVKGQLESNKVELRNFYQGQVEILVQNKLKEFQNQLDQAEYNFKEDLKRKEMSIAKTAASHIHQISEKFTLEIKLLEEKHSEEIRLYRIQIMQYKQQVDSLQIRLDQMQEKRSQIAQQLQRVMESQWNEALKIIGGKTPQPEENFSTINQLNSLRTRSYNNLEEILSQENSDDNADRKCNKKLTKRDTQPTMEEFYKQGNGDLPQETPVSSRISGNKPVKDNELQKYIQMLLNRQPGNPLSDQGNQGPQKNEAQPFGKSMWEQLSPEEQDRADTQRRKGSQADKRFDKPPWK